MLAVDWFTKTGQPIRMKLMRNKSSQSIVFLCEFKTLRDCYWLANSNFVCGVCCSQTRRKIEIGKLLIDQIEKWQPLPLRLQPTRGLELQARIYRACSTMGLAGLGWRYACASNREAPLLSSIHTSWKCKTCRQFCAWYVLLPRLASVWNAVLQAHAYVATDRRAIISLLYSVVALPRLQNATPWPGEQAERIQPHGSKKPHAETQWQW